LKEMRIEKASTQTNSKQGSLAEKHLIKKGVVEEGHEKRCFTKIREIRKPQKERLGKGFHGTNRILSKKQ